jgi:hypothetical protein
MKQLLNLILLLIGFFMTSSCDEKISNPTDKNTELAVGISEAMSADSAQKITPDKVETKDKYPDAIKKDLINYPAISKEEKVDRKTADGAGGYLDRSDRSDCEIFKFTFSDGSTGKLVLRDDTWFSYSVRGKNKEKPFVSKEDGLQEIWETSQKLEKFGAGIGAAMSKKGVPLKKDGTPDKRYSVNK